MIPFTCPSCGEQHDDLPHIGDDRPIHYWDVPEAERSQRIFLTDDLCSIDNELFFVRGVIEIPVHDYPEGFGFGVWVSHKKENWEIYRDNFNSAEIGPFFGWLCTRINFYEEDTDLLKCMVHYQGKNLRPRVKLEPSAHQLSIDQHQGITLDKALEIVHCYQDRK